MSPVLPKRLYLVDAVASLAVGTAIAYWLFTYLHAVPASQVELVQGLLCVLGAIAAFYSLSRGVLQACRLILRVFNTGLNTAWVMAARRWHHYHWRRAETPEIEIPDGPPAPGEVVIVLDPKGLRL